MGFNILNNSLFFGLVVVYPVRLPMKIYAYINCPAESLSFYWLAIVIAVHAGKIWQYRAPSDIRYQAFMQIHTGQVVMGYNIGHG